MQYKTKFTKNINDESANILTTSKLITYDNITQNSKMPANMKKFKYL